MAERPKLTVDVEIAGAKQGINDLEAVVEAQDDVAAAAARTGAAAEKAGKQAEGGAGRWRKLVDRLKEGAEGAAGAAAGLSGMAITLKGDLDPEVEKSVGALQGLSGALAGFGPLGALASVAVSGVATAVAFFGGAADEASVASEGFLERALKPMIDAMVTAADKADALTGSVRRMQVASQSEFEIFTPDEVLQADKYRTAIAENVIKVQTLGREIEEYKRKAQGLSADGSSVWSPQAEDMAMRGRALEEAKQTLDFERKNLDMLEAAARARAAGQAAPTASSRGPAGPDWKVAYQAEVDAALAATQAIRQDRETDIYLQMSAADALAKEAMRAASEVQAAWSKAWYSNELEQAIAAGTAAQREAIRSIEAEAATLIGMYDRLRIGVTDFGTAAVNGYAAAAVSAAIYGGSQMEVANQVLAAEAEKALTQAAIATATGFGYLAAAAFGFGPGVQAAGLSFLSAGMWGAVGGAAALGAELTGGFGGAGSGPGMGAVGPGGGPATGRPEDFGRSPAAAEPQDRELFINLTSGGGAGQPLSRGDAGAVIGALVQIAKDGGLRLETRRA